MRSENVVLSVICVVGLLVAVRLAWRWRDLPVLPSAAHEPSGPGDAAARGLRSVVSVVAAGTIAGVLVAGLGGRLMMRLVAATSSDAAQGRLTEADEIVGEITLGGTIGFVLFAGLLAGALAGFVYLPTRHFLPDRAWPAGLVFGLGLLATIGVADPLSSDNVDFSIVSPVPLAVGFIVALGLLFGATLAALAARFESTTRLLRPGHAAETGTRLTYGSLVLLLPAAPLLGLAAAYVGGRAVARGRVGAALDTRPVRAVALGIGVVAAAVASWRVGIATADIL